MLEPNIVFKMQVQLETVKGIHPEFIKQCITDLPMV